MLWKAIGKGSFGIVWKSKILSGPRKDELVAIKIINLDDFRDKSADEIRVRGGFNTVRKKSRS